MCVCVCVCVCACSSDIPGTVPKTNGPEIVLKKFPQNAVTFSLSFYCPQSPLLFRRRQVCVG
jgi:hypothetical protein